MIERVRRVFLDSAPLIYFVEKEAKYWDAVSLIFDRIDAGLMMAITSAVTLAECLVLPYRKKNLRLAQELFDCIVNGNNILFVSLDHDMARRAAEMRARYNLSLSDAFLTNDADLRRIIELQVLVLDDMRETR